MNDPDSGHRPNMGGKYLTFYLGDEEYGIGILKVFEIIGLQEITPVPRTPDFIKGVINLRGTIHPIIDLKRKFGMGTTALNPKTSIIVVDIGSDGREEKVGILVDRVSEVLKLDAEIIEELPNSSDSLLSDHIIGVAKVNEAVIILLNINDILSRCDFENVSEKT